LGAVLSRYDGVGGYDWVAIPLIPYLYAVDQPDDIPLFVDPKMVNFLRDQYRRKHLEAVAPDKDDGETPGGNWYELVGSSYDRTVYAFEIETTSAQDEAFIRRYNSSPNDSHFHLVTRNCADFAKDVLNFYYPRALHRSIVADAGITTPKQMAKTLIKFGSRHPQLRFSRFVIPQIPGSGARSTPVHGVVESFLKSKKYIVPSAVVSPIFAGCVAAVYLGSGAGHFDPARQALVYNAHRELEPAMGREDQRSYQLELSHLAAAAPIDGGAVRAEKLAHVMRDAAPDLDVEGHPILRIHQGDDVVSVGISGSNILANDVGEQFTAQLLEARLRSELRGGSPKASESDVTRDWNLLQKARNGSANDMPAAPVRPAAQTRADRPGNRP
jgi:hypothetical protein